MTHVWRPTAYVVPAAVVGAAVARSLGAVLPLHLLTHEARRPWPSWCSVFPSSSGAAPHHPRDLETAPRIAAALEVLLGAGARASHVLSNELFYDCQSPAAASSSG